MKISKKPTHYIFVKASSDSESDSCDFAIINCGEEWKQIMNKRLDAAKPFEDDKDFCSLKFFESAISFYATNDDADEILSMMDENTEWVFVELREEEEDEFISPDGRPSGPAVFINKHGFGHFIAYGRYSDEPFYTPKLSFTDILRHL